MSESNWEIWDQQRLEGTLCDVVLIVSGVQFRAHKIILSACSEYFRMLLTSGHWTCSEQSEYTIPDVAPDIIELIVTYAYTHKAHITPTNVQDLLVTADMLGVMDIVSLCWNFLEKQLHPQNCIGICRFSELYSRHELRQRAYSYILQHFEEVVREPAAEFLELTLPQLSAILDEEELKVKQEETLFEAVLKWIGHAPALRSGYIQILLPKVRMSLMNGNYLLDNVMHDPMVRSHQEYQHLITRVLRTTLHICRNGLTDACFRDPLSRPRIPRSILFAIGGFIDRPTNAIEAYDSSVGRWTSVPWVEESPRAYHGIAFLDGHLYVIGGLNNNEYFSTVQKFNPITHTWHQVGHMHFSRCYVSVAVLDGHIYAMGGFNGQQRMNSVERYNPKTNQWSLIPPMHEIRSDASATTLNGKVYICGGFNGAESLFTAECFDPLANQWTRIADMQSSRSGVAVVAFKQRVFAVGGYDGLNRLQTAEAYDPNLNIWRSVSPMFHGRSNFGIEVLDGGIFVAGGHNGYRTMGSCECYDDTTDQWFDVPDMEVHRSALKCWVVSEMPSLTESSLQRPV